MKRTRDGGKAEVSQAPKTDLPAAVRRARIENAERADAIAELREIELGRLALLESELKPVVQQAPPGVDLFDLTLSHGERPRLFLDMVAFVEMGHDRRTYRFFQDTVHGRVLIAESQQVDRVAAAVTNYVARRLIERERALSAESSEEARQPAAWSIRPATAEEGAVRKPKPSEAPREAPPPAAVAAEEVAPNRTWTRRASDAFAFFLMTLGSATFLALMALAFFLAWTLRLRALWTRWFGLPPF